MSIVKFSRVRSRRLAGVLAAGAAFLALSGSSVALARQGSNSQAPTVNKVDQKGDDLVGMRWDGESCIQTDADPEPVCTSLGLYSFANMEDTSTTGDEITRQLEMGYPMSATCEGVQQTMSFREVQAPKGYDRAPGELKLCLVYDGWVVMSNTSRGRITYDAAANVVTFHDRLLRKPPTTKPGTNNTGTKPGMLPSTGSVTTPLALGGAALLILGFGAVFSARRRPVIHGS